MPVTRATSEPSPRKSEFETLIIGAGPAGLQLAYYLEQAERDYLVLEAGDGPGTFFRTFPRHRTLISINKVYSGYEDPEVNLRWDWNSLLCDDPELLFRCYSREYFPHADAMVRYLGDFARRFGLKVSYDSRVTRVSRDGSGFSVETGGGNRLGCQRLVVASGISQPFLPDIPGIEHAEPYPTMTLDRDSFANQRVLILGKGNSGFETADHLTPTTALIHIASPNPIRMAWQTHFVGHLRAVNNNFLDTYQLKSQNAVLDGTVQGIERRPDDKLEVAMHYSHAEEEVEPLVYDRVLLCTGFRFDDSIFDADCRPEPSRKTNDRFPEQTSEWESTNVAGLYFAGTLMQVRDYKQATSGFIHGFRYNVRALSRMLELKHHHRPWPSKTIPGGVEGLSRAILQRINQTSALWQLFGFAGELFVVDRDGCIRYFPELPVAYIRDSPFGLHPDHYVLTLEFGHCPGDPFSIERHPNPERAEASTFLHPVIRHYHGATMVGELHLLENLFGEWHDQELHVRPLESFLARQLGDRRQAAEPAMASG